MMAASFFYCILERRPTYKCLKSMSAIIENGGIS